MSNAEETNVADSAATLCSLAWFGADVAATWPVGCKVLIRRRYEGSTWYEADNWHRPDWVSSKSPRIEWAMIEQAE